MRKVAARSLLMAPVAIGTLALAPAAVAATPAFPPLEHGTYATVAVPRAAFTIPSGVNDAGVIVGCFQRRTGPMRGFIDRHGRYVTITDPAAATGRKGETCAAGIDNAGTIVGVFVDRSGVFHGFVHRNGRFTTIDEPDAGRKSNQGTIAVEINKSGVIVGWFVTSRNAVKGFILKDGVFTDIRNPAAETGPGSETVLNGVADDGVMTGLYIDRRGGENGFWYRRGVFHKVDVPGANSTDLLCISERTGMLVGSYQPHRGWGHRTFTVRHGVFRTLPKPSSDTIDAFPGCVNDRGRVVGDYYTSRRRTVGFRFRPSARTRAIPRSAGSAPGTTPVLRTPRLPA